MDPESTTPDSSTASRLRSRASRIITVKHRSVFYPLVIFFVLANICLSFAVNCVLMGLLFAWLLLVIIHVRNPAFLGARLGRSASRTADRIRAFPLELLQVVTIVYITVSSKLPFPPGDSWLAERWAPITYTLALVLGAALDHVGNTRPQAGRGIRRWLKRIFSRKPSQETSNKEQQDVSIVSRDAPLRLDSSELINLMTAEEEAWHLAQQERWRDWIAEETERFRGDFH
ncbi:MAG: hypothetical protein ACI8W8_004128 [Rhodothermales bacterium]|jgi:hypothetical protein